MTGAAVPRDTAAEDEATTRLVARVQAGDRAALTELYVLFFDRVYGYMRVALRDSHEAEDATQQVFINAIQALPRYEPRRPFRTWLFTIARNLAITRLRESGRVETVDPESLERRIEADADDQDLPALDWISDGDLLQFVERLPEAQRQALVLRHVLGFSATEIGQIMERSADDVRMLQHRAHGFLRERLAALGRSPRRREHRLEIGAHRGSGRVARTRRHSLRAPRLSLS